MVSYKRHLLKTITWRILGTLDTIVISMHMKEHGIILFLMEYMTQKIK